MPAGWVMSDNDQLIDTRMSLMIIQMGKEKGKKLADKSKISNFQDFGFPF